MERLKTARKSLNPQNNIAEIKISIIFAIFCKSILGNIFLLISDVFPSLGLNFEESGKIDLCANFFL